MQIIFPSFAKEGLKKLLRSIMEGKKKDSKIIPKTFSMEYIFIGRFSEDYKKVLNGRPQINTF